MIIESLDPDSKTRRVSPVAVLCEEYMDLVNGPAKRNWGERQSIFPVIVPIGMVIFSHGNSTISKVFLT